MQLNGFTGQNPCGETAVLMLSNSSNTGLTEQQNAWHGWWQGIKLLRRVININWWLPQRSLFFPFCSSPKDYCKYDEISNKPPFKQLTGALQVIGQSQGWLHLRKNLSTLGKQKQRFPKYLKQKKGALQLLTWRQAYFVLRGISWQHLSVIKWV